MTRIEYVPGVCNIGSQEIARRRNLGWVFLAISVALLLALVLTGVEPGWRSFVFFPAAMSASGFLQTHFHFCSGFARIGAYNFDSIGQMREVDDELSKKKDKKKGNQITFYAVLIAGVTAIIAVALV